MSTPPTLGSCPGSLRGGNEPGHEASVGGEVTPTPVVMSTV